MSSGEQNEPMLLLTSPLGDDTLPVQVGTLHAIELHAVEEISSPFKAVVTVVSSEGSIDPQELLYQSVGLTIRRPPREDRYINGVVRRMDAIGQARRDRWMYRLRVVPRLWFLGQAEDSRIFQNMNAQEILQKIFNEHGVRPVDFRIYRNSPVREYTTQYNETDLAFVQRLMQESGWFYFFEHTKTAHTLVITDGNEAFKPVSAPPHWVIHEGNNVDVFDRWDETNATAHGEVWLQDYDPTKPTTPVEGKEDTTLPTAGPSQRDVYNWPALTMDKQIAADRAKFRIQHAEVVSALCHGHGYDHEFEPGRRFTLARNPFTGAEGVEYAVRSVSHDATDDTWIAGAGKGHYENSFTCFLQRTPWRDDARNTRPLMAGIFPAIVLGDSGEEIHADALGRIKVRLMFDHRKETVAGMAIWVRVIQPWAGNSWGWQHLPRVGTEVAVAFMSGDPDNPVVAGGVYNEVMQPVFPVPSEQTKSGIRSRSTLRGGTQDYSEFSIDDKKGQELVLLHAQKDHKIEVEHDQDATIGNDRKVVTHRNDSLESETGDITITAATSITLRVGASTIKLTPASIAITAPALTFTSEAAMEFAAGAAVNFTVGAAFTVEAAANVTLLTPTFFALPPIPPVV
ncbi:type VI secretion system tip protein VgrG [Rhizobium sp. P32RR-XVIII]|uniref:type VI secretion system Vgr family protein n=1 Tax=Rhizobium sp. P32RR-XVIII TaxID=2726738 RepID=UPI0014575C27|nr:type VI secretion system tip protein TssI/VgrG [Rhizobium sp. P32RR-XVIII]NLS08000.1 type VI secretion system tip protein VgrG [Rhizobium sp. P32RR-XVIII]